MTERLCTNCRWHTEEGWRDFCKNPTLNDRSRVDGRAIMWPCDGQRNYPRPGWLARKLRLPVHGRFDRCGAEGAYFEAKELTA